MEKKKPLPVEPSTPEISDIDKDDFLSKLEKVVNTKQNKVFSVNQVKNRKEPKTKEEPQKNRFKEIRESGTVTMDLSSDTEPTFGFITDDSTWENLMDRFDDISPIEDITLDERMRYKRKGSGDKFDDMFNKELSMLNDLLSDVNSRSKIINKRISTMTSKGSYGVSKGLTDLIEGSNSLDNTKLNAIKAIADLKKSAFDMRLKEMKVNPQVEEEDVDTIADQFYKSIIGGGSGNFIQSSMSQYSVDEYLNQDDGGMFNLSSGIPMDDDPYDEDINTADKYGYIANENSNVEICIHRFSDGTLSFVALDDGGRVVDGYELPDPYLLETIDIKPMSKYGFDSYMRKYKIIDVNTDAVDLSDIDDDRYDDVTDDDKYEY